MTESDGFGWEAPARTRRPNPPRPSRPAEPPRTGTGERRCIDCDPSRPARPTPHPGPRCTTHDRAVKLRRKVVRQGDQILAGFGITSEEYWEIYRLQGGKCAWCRRATGTGRKRLAVDHDHACPVGHDPKKGCRLCVRGLLCSTCNKFIGWLRDSVNAIMRGIHYLSNPPAAQVLGPRSVNRAVDGVHSAHGNERELPEDVSGGSGFTFD